MQKNQYILELPTYHFNKKTKVKNKTVENIIPSKRTVLIAKLLWYMFVIISRPYNG